MRLIELRLKNLNSLKGEWHIDFTNAAFINEGIFAITGQTGAGKTTILDAICLALYAQTPRIDSISKSSNEVMTRQTADCFSEVVIEIGKNRYRCHWGQRRARNKANGNLQDATHEIANANTDEMLESGIKKTKARIQDLIGMDFNQFTRSIMLAQGSFAAFLKSDVADRAAILEKITGTAIYAEISKNVFEKKRHEETQLAKLQAGIDSLPLLSDEDEAQLRVELTTLKQEQAAQRITFKTVSDQLQWLDKVAELQQSLTQYQGRMADAVQAQKAFVPESMRLDAANKALEIDSPFRELTYSRKKVQDLQAENTSITQELPTQQQHLEQANSELRTATTVETKATTALNDTLPIIAKVRDLDNDINQQTRLLADDTQRKNILATSMQNLRQQIDTHQQTESDIKNQLSHIEKYFSDYPELNNLDSDIPTFNDSCIRLKTLLTSNISLTADKATQHQKMRERQDKADTLSKKLETDKSSISQQRTQLASLQQQQDAIVKNQSVASMRSEQEQIGKISAHIEQVGFKLQHLSEISDQINQIDLTLPALNKELATLADSIVQRRSDLQEAKSKQQEKQEHLRLLQKVAKLEDYIIELEDGTPCPLCGAHEHPYGNDHPLLDKHVDCDKPQSQTQQTQQQIDELGTFIESIEQALSNDNIKHATKQSAINSEQQQLANLQQRSTTLASDAQSVLVSILHTQNTYTQALAEITQPLTKMSDFYKSANAFDTANIKHFTTILNHTKQQLNQQKQSTHTILAEYDTRAEQIIALNRTIEADEKQQQALIDEVNSITTDIKLISQKIKGIEHHINVNFAELVPIMTAVCAQVDKYPIDKYKAYLDTALNSADIQAALSHLHHSIQTQVVLSKTECDTHINQLRQKSSALKELKQIFNEQVDQQHQLNNSLSSITAQIDTKQQQLASEEAALQQLDTLITAHTKTHQQLQAERETLFSDKNPDHESNRLHTALDEAKNKTAIVQRQADNAAQLLKQSQSRAQQLANELDIAMTTLNEQQTNFTALLAQSQFTSEADFEQARLPKETRDDLKNRQFIIEQTLNQTKAQLQATQQSLDEQLANPLTDEPRDVLAGKQHQLQTEIDTRFGALGAIEQQLTTNEQQKTVQSEQHTAIAAQKETMQVWQQLYELIGSADGKKYRTFAQGLTFQVMIDHANKQLAKMSNRYLLIHDADNALELNVIDDYQGGDIRSTKNLSGGEGFIISLALALGLSQMASQNIRVDSLFLDEGFGTLDEESLDIALDTLTSLQQEGKIIGIISHVQALKERILTQIKVEKISGGFSQISGQGCRKVIAEDEKSVK
ncbi:AAA family ATPase [Psychrobacter sp. AOP7-B1-24]|uniref:AAA family ATPase n=1 Tax=Psychrobacter sp. AOP7-B1-24 TaxID=3457645 RepID=UPI00402B4080